MNAKDKIAFLRQEILEHNHKYYVLNTPSISDFEYKGILFAVRRAKVSFSIAF